ncbi:MULTISPECIES: DUF5719 family protein [Nocardioides]|uniref:DUF5719 family protein n=1 Tax=Nocardioides vastitatis TaxID=2568655 RepID=A0ABW0ZMB3_9ACTN|nr:DUF5719 family protein [Nocardioides sp.]THJ03914.1 hypothetical protein E7Z54_09240 [Nocardioides sp.]
MSEQSPGRRASVLRRRRVDIVVALAIALPMVVAISIAFIGEEPDPLAGRTAPQTSPLTAATVVCPEASAGSARPVRVTRSPGVAGGEVAVHTSQAGADILAEAPPVTVEEGSSVVVPNSGGATTLDGEGAAAPGLIAGRSDRLAVPECRAPSYDEWLVGLGASARYSSTLELVNPDDGDAVVDVTLYGAGGPIEEPALRGIQVPAHGVKRIDLAEEAPRRGATAAHLTSTRGRVTATVRNTRDPLGRGRVTSDFLPAQSEPSTEALILGLPASPSGPMLDLANPGVDEARATVRLITEESVFTPADSEDIQVPPQSMTSVNLRSMLQGEAATGVVGIVVESTIPLASSVRLLSKGDLALLAPVPELREPTSAVLPAGAKTLLLGGATGIGTVHVRSYDAAGEVLAEERVEVGPDRAATLALRPRAVTIDVEARNTAVGGLVMIPARGAHPGLATLRLRAGEVYARIPGVRPQ